MTIRFAHGRPYLVQWINVPYHEGRVVFMLNGKCGNSSVKTAVLKAEGHAEVARPHRMAETWSPARAARSGYRCIAVARNPYARAVSLWNQKIIGRGRSGLWRKGAFEKGMEFVPFLREVIKMGEHEDVHVRSQWIGMTHRGRFLPEHIHRIEEPECWAEVQALAPGLPDLEQRNASGAPPWEALCEGEAGALIRTRWARDFEVFGYEK
ncbi:sulfotransferase family 2 domain-containing protein [Oceanibium sediminis]|uniref:sulfotransferase family 2 domain-containing protein n=1 Tax=Oceanibium sediminis TaxID=2026339 RepID=UPI000DD483AD|nr:sulfotransferase family 2 domain-containing protein [Oceanibium sediminis]